MEKERCSWIDLCRSFRLSNSEKQQTLHFRLDKLQFLLIDKYGVYLLLTPVLYFEVAAVL